ncbi:hypothetical protein DEO72_LG6g1403 [Vigna unguiculata]|uniref:Uncharacterized protein n=1 Tax=Vigna unguiculata TaxID=3917 RepID=A0A4D6M635_VIGUN|nr:hypothetical protein DEO72_LG6g1403 [Vigna unguiculata]
MARSDVFVQASLSRLGETSKNRPKFALKLSLKRRALILSEPKRGTSPLGEGWPHSGEESSPQRELVSLVGLFVDSLA